MAHPTLQQTAETVLQSLHKQGLTHLNAIARGANIVVFSEYDGVKDNCFRLSKLSGTSYALHVADHKGTWEATPYAGSATELLELIFTQFSWILEDI
jgi:hypothetical protein